MAKTSANANLHKAKTEKKDEFYTQLNDIENELSHYKTHFKNKVVYCNCDDPLASNFFKYFFLNFKYLELKELITTCYKSQNFREFSAEDSPKKAYAIKITRDCEVDTVGEPSEVLSEIEKLLSLSLSDSPTQSKETIEAFEKNKHKLKSKTTLLKSDKTQNKGQSLLPIFEDKNLDNAGDFRSQDCIELLKQSDIVVTNPPFSLFREYVAQLVEYKKKFVIIMPLGGTSYKEIFRLIKENKLWLGYGFKAGNAYFKVQGKNESDFAKGVYDTNTGLVKFRNVTWGTNLDIKKRHEILETIYTYSKYPEKYPKYDKYDAINVDKTNEIPMDYDGVMGVPITFLDIHNPKQFEIIGMLASSGYDKDIVGIEFLGNGDARAVINGKAKYSRVLIKKRKEKK